MDDLKKTVALVEPDANPLGHTLVNTVATNKMHEPMDLVALAKQVQKADSFTRATAGGKLNIIVEQIRFLQEQARKVLHEAKRDHDLHHTACNIVKKPGQTYFLYERESGQEYFSLLSPEEWGSSLTHKFLGAYRLERDQSWTPVEHLEQRNEEFALVDKLLQRSITTREAILLKSFDLEDQT